MKLSSKHIVNLWDFQSQEIKDLINHAIDLKKETKKGVFSAPHQNKNLGLIFSKPSLRTRVSFEIGARQLGMGAITLKQDEINLGVRETIEDTASVLSRYVDCIMIRTFSHQDVETFAKHSKVPVINGLTDNSHPCQIMADLLTVQEVYTDLKGLKLCFVGDGNNVANSLLVGCAHVGMDVSILCPKGYEPMETYVNKAKKIASLNGMNAKIEITSDIKEGMKNADVVYTDVWASMGQEEEQAKRKQIFQPYQINSELLSLAKKEAMVLHCLPAHREEEITHEVMEKNAQYIFEQAENRMHAQKAIMDMLLS